MNKNILFFSRKCKFCNQLLTIMNNANLIPFFILYCVDDHRDNLPVAVKKVPTLIVSGVPKPLVADDAFTWVNQYISLQQKTPLQNSQMNYNNGSVLEWNKQEMTGLSDVYTHKDLDVNIPHSYSNAKQNTGGILTAKEINDKIKTTDQAKLISNLAEKRAQQDMQLGQMQQEQLVNIVMQNKY